MNDKNKKSGRIRSQIQNVKADKTSPGFTAVIMKEIMAESENEVAVNSSLKSLLCRNGIEKSPDSLARNVMSIVKVRAFEPAFKPLISRRTWNLIALTGVFFIIWQAFSDQAATSDLGLTSYAVHVGNRLTSIFARVPALYLITFFAVSTLVLLDYLLNRRSNTASKSRLT